MIKQLALVIVVVLAIIVSVFIIQRVTQFNSHAFGILDFVSSFHQKIGDPGFNPDLDVNKDGTINTLDILSDRYAQEATSSAESVDLSKILNSSGEASGSGN